MPINFSKEEATKILEEQESNITTEERAVEERGKEKNFEFLMNQSEMERVGIEEQKKIIAMRGSWSFWILRLIIAITIFDFIVIFSIGLKWFNFDGYIVPVFITESLIKVLGLAIIIVGFLFNKNDKNLL